MTLEKIFSSMQAEANSIKEEFSDIPSLEGKIQDLLENCICLSFSKKAEGRKEEAKIFLRCAVALEAAMSYADYRANLAYIEGKEEVANPEGCLYSAQPAAGFIDEEL